MHLSEAIQQTRWVLSLWYNRQDGFSVCDTTDKMGSQSVIQQTRWVLSLWYNRQDGFSVCDSTGQDGFSVCDRKSCYGCMVKTSDSEYKKPPVHISIMPVVVLARHSILIGNSTTVMAVESSNFRFQGLLSCNASQNHGTINCIKLTAQ